MVTDSSILAGKTPWTEKPGRLQAVGSQRVEHNWATSLPLSGVQSFLIRKLLIILLMIPRMWQPTYLLLISGLSLSVFVFWKFDYSVSQHESFWVHLPWRLLSFLDLYIHVFHHIWVVFSQYFFTYSLCLSVCLHFFWDSYDAYVDSHDGVPHVP